MSKLMKKVSMLFALVAVCFLFTTGIKVSAASKTYQEVGYNSAFGKKLSDRIKVGKYYFHFDKNERILYSKKAKDKGKYLAKKQIPVYTNGKYAFFLDDNNTLWRVTLSSNKAKKIKKLNGIANMLVGVYGNKVYFMDVTIDDDGTLRSYDMKSKKVKVIKKKVGAEAITSEGKYIIYNVGKNSYLYDCSKGKAVKYSSKSNYQRPGNIYKGCVYYVDTKSNFIQYKISSKKTKTIAPVPGAKDQIPVIMGYDKNKVAYEVDITIQDGEELNYKTFRYIVDFTTGKVLSKKELPSD